MSILNSSPSLKVSVRNLTVVLILLAMAALACGGRGGGSSGGGGGASPSSGGGGGDRNDSRLVGTWEAQEFLGMSGDTHTVVHRMRLDSDGSFEKSGVGAGKWWVEDGELKYSRDGENYTWGKYSISGNDMLTANGSRRLSWHRQ